MKKIFLLLLLFGLLQNEAFSQPMSAPAVNTIRIIDDTSVELCWIVPSLNGNVFNEYQIYYSNDPLGTFNLIQTVTNQLQNTVTITGLPIVNTSRYFYVVTRFNTNQLSVNSDTIISILLNVTQNANGHMVLNWNPIHTPAFPTTQGTYRVFRRILPAPGYTQLAVSPTTTTHIDSTIWHPVCNETIFYRIELGDNMGICTSISNERESTFSNIPPEPPVLNAVTVTSLPPLQDVTLTWDISPSRDVEGYKIYQLTNAGSPIEVADVPGRLSITTTLTAANPPLASLPNSFSETYRVAAYDSCGLIGNPSLFHHTIFLESELDACNGIITLNWNSYMNWPQGVGAYEIYVSQNGSPFAVLATVGPNDTTYQHFPLIQSTLYTYKVRAIDVTGFLFSESSFTEMIADVPVRPAFLYFKYATVVDNRTVDIMFYHDVTADVTEYKIFRSDNLGDTFDSIISIPFNPNSAFITYRDTVKCLTFQKSYVYRAVAYDLCGQPVYNSNNVAKTIFLRAATELDMENTITWSDYENWNGEVRSYKVFRGFQGVFSDIPAATIPFGENLYTDDISNRISKDGEYCYYVQAYQGLDTLNFFADSSRSNKVCIKQMKTFYMPNAFQPDGINKVFKPASTFLNANNYRFQIFNKWGERVFETVEPTTGWDGTINGREARMDVYVYRITYQDENFETQEVRGTVTLLR
jgi:gliding motility-associated-like protein